MAVYLIHFHTKLGRCQHYLGYAKDVDSCIAAHRAKGGDCIDCLQRPEQFRN